MSDGANPFAYLKAAASGDVGAQRALAQLAVDEARRDPATAVASLCDGLHYARLAACIGTRRDRGQLISILALIGTTSPDPEARRLTQAELLATASIFADGGDEELASAINAAIAEVDDPGVLEMAKACEPDLRSAYA